MVTNVTVKNISSHPYLIGTDPLAAGATRVVDLELDTVQRALQRHRNLVILPGGDGSDSPIQTVTTPLDHDQIIALRTTGVEVIPPPDSGKILDPLRFFLNARIPGGAADSYAGISADSYFNITYGESVATLITVSNDTYFGNNFVEAVLGSASSDGTNTLFLGPGYDVGSPDWGAQPIFENRGGDLAGIGIYLKLVNAAGNLTGGDPGNSLVVTSLYWTVDLTGLV